MQITLLCCGPRTESRPERLLSINIGQFHVILYALLSVLLLIE